MESKREEIFLNKTNDIVTELERIGQLFSGLKDDISEYIDDYKRLQITAAQGGLEDAQFLLDKIGYLEVSPVGIIVINNDDIIKYVNSSCVKLLGYTADEMMDKNVLDLMNTDQKQELAGHIRMFSEEINKTFDVGLYTKDNKRIHVLANFMVLKKEDKIIGKIGAFHDITKIHEENQRILENEQYYAYLVNNGADCMYCCNLEGKITFFSKNAERLLGYKSDEIINKHFSILIENVSWGKLKEELKMQRDDERRTYQTVLISKSGRKIAVLQRVMPVYKKDVVTERANVVTNITGQREVEQELLSATQKLSALIQFGTTVASTLSLQELLDFVVKSVSEFVQVDASLIRLFDKECYDLVLHTSYGIEKGGCPERIPLVGTLCGKVLKEKRTIIVPELNTEPLHKSLDEGEAIKFSSLLIVPLIVKDEAVGVLCLYTKEPVEFTKQQIDSTHTFASQATVAIENARLYTLEQATVAKLKDLDNAKSDFLSMVSHELRSPLTSIKGYTSLILAGRVGQINEQQKKFLSIVESQSNHLTGLISDLLDLSRIESGRITMRKVSVSMKVIAETIAERMMPQMMSKNITLTVDAEEGMPFILGDPERLGQIYTNLITNAFKFTPEGGKITLKSWKEGDCIECRIIDTGIGLTKENLKKVFEKFYQVDNTSTRAAGGVGLGLSIIKKILEAHKGRIWAESEGIGKGATMCFSIPFEQTDSSKVVNEDVKEEEPKEDEKDKMPGYKEEEVEKPVKPVKNAIGEHIKKVAAEGNKKNILIVDDDEEVVNLLKIYLQDEGYIINKALTGREAFVSACENVPDLITLDIKLPDIDGYQVIDLLKSDDRTKDIPVMILSIVPLVEDKVDEVFRLGIVDYLSKPIDRDRLMDSVNRILRVKGKAKGAYVMVVDDDPDIVGLVKLALKDAGYGVIEAFNGEQALELADREKPDLIILDIMMPEMDGYDVIKNLKKNKKTQNIPVIILSVRRLEEDKAKGLKLGAIKYLTKPFKAKDLLGEIKEVLEWEKK